MNTVVGDEKNYNLQKVDPFFTDAQGVYTRQFERMLGCLNGRTSTNQLCIEEFVIKSEKNWYNRFHDAKLGKVPVRSQVNSIRGDDSSSDSGSASTRIENEFELDENHVPPTGARKFLQHKIGDWPLYSFLLALVSGNFRQLAA